MTPTLKLDPSMSNFHQATTTKKAVHTLCRINPPQLCGRLTDQDIAELKMASTMPTRHQLSKERAVPARIPALSVQIVVYM
jgi:hypothetical protein